MNLRDTYFSEDVEEDIKHFLHTEEKKRVLVFPPFNNYKRFLIHQLIQDSFSNLLQTFSIGQGISRRIVICFKTDIKGLTINDSSKILNTNNKLIRNMGIENENSTKSPESPVLIKSKMTKSIPTAEIYRPPALRRQSLNSTENSDQATNINSNSKILRQKRPDREVYVPRHRRHILESQDDIKEQDNDSNFLKSNEHSHSSESHLRLNEVMDNVMKCSKNADLPCLEAISSSSRTTDESYLYTNSIQGPNQKDTLKIYSDDEKQIVKSEENQRDIPMSMDEDIKDCDNFDSQILKRSSINEIELALENGFNEENVRKSEEVIQKSQKMTDLKRDECDWDVLFNDSGECLDPTLMEELTAAVGEVIVEKPKNSYKTESRQIEVSNDEFGHVIEMYDFPSDFKTCDLAHIFNPFKNGGFELRWVDDTHCLGIFSSPLVAAEVLAYDHPLVKTRPLTQASALSKSKVKKTSEFLLPYRNRPETCAALARRLVTGALGVRLATAKQEREKEKVLLREAKEKRRLANKQKDDAWEGIFSNE